MPRSRLSHWLLLLVVSVAGCAERKSAPAAPKPPEVLVGTPVERQVRDFEYFTGRTESSRRVDIRARVTGYLDKVYFAEGQMVKQGDLLFRIDPRPYKAELDRAKADLERATAHLHRIDADLQRAETLLRNRAIGREEYDRILGDRDEAKAEVGVEESNVRLAELQLDFTDVRAPFDGRIGRTQVDPGNLVRADDTMLTTLVALEPMYVYFDVDERTFLRKMLGTDSRDNARDGKIAIQIGLVDEDGFPHNGLVNFMDNVVDSSTGTLWLRGEFNAPKRPITPGLFSRIRFPLGKPYTAVTVAEQALGTDQGQRFLFVVDDQNIVRYRPVQVGPLENGMRVIRQGLQPGERVVVSGLQRIRAGAPITPKEVDMDSLLAKGTPEDKRTPVEDATAPSPGASKADERSLAAPPSKIPTSSPDMKSNAKANGSPNSPAAKAQEKKDAGLLTPTSSVHGDHKPNALPTAEKSP